jgi:AcrR family transcriptional regulator
MGVSDLCRNNFGRGTLGQANLKIERTRGMKPKDPSERAACVAAAVRALEKIGATFTVADIADRAGLSRSTIYRSRHLRALIGAKGDGPRVVDARLHAGLSARHESAKAKARDLRRRLAETERSWDEMRERALTAERRLLDAERRIRLLEAQTKMQRESGSPLFAIAARLGPEAIRQARRQLARALHPDLFAADTAAALLATELLKTINSLTD